MEIPGYTIVDTLGRGGMATVYLAIQQSFEREVALKVLSPDLLRDPAFGERFLREAKIVSRLVHPNIVTVYDVGVHENWHYLSMEYVPGEDLKHRRSQLTRAQGLKVVMDVARALDYAARKGYVHRDVKPENIMLHAEDGRAVLMDFGIARPTGMESGMTQTGTAIGTPHYMSPEQAKGKPVDARSDLYSLGVVLFLLVAGRVPFDADSAVAVGIKHVAKPIPRLPSALRLFQPIIDKVLAKNPDQRYQSGQELVDDLAQITQDDLRQVDELIELAGKRMSQTDPDAPTVISAALNHAETSQIDAADEPDAGAQHWPQRGQAVTSINVSAVPARASNPFGASHWLRNSLLLLLLVAGLLFSFRQQLPAPWPDTITRYHHWGLDRIKASGLPLAERHWQWLYAIGQPESAGLARPAPVPAEPKPQQSSEPPAPMEPAPPSGQSTDAAGPAPRAAPVDQQLADQVLADTRPVLGEQGLRAEPQVTGSPSAASAQPPDEPSAEARDAFARAEQLLAGLPENLELGDELAQIYREQMDNPEQRARARQGLEQVAGFYQESAQQALADGDLARGRALVDSASASFPKLADAQRFRRLVRRLEEAEAVQSLLAQGRAQLARDALSSPAGDNAVESFQQVLARQADNPQALAGLVAVADRYARLAAAKLQAGDWLSAKGMVSRGLQVQPRHRQLLSMQDQVTQAEQSLRERQQAVAAGLQRAETALAAGNVYGQNGAVAAYQQVLQVDPDNAGARRGIEAATQRSADLLRDLINQQQLERAQQELQLAEPWLGDQPALVALKQDLLQAVEAARPRVDSLRIGATDQLDFGQGQPLVRGVDRTIYIGLQFHNFADAAVLQAILFDGARSLQIAQVPVVITSQQGEKVFRIDRPVEGFSAGGYNLDLMLENQLLLSQRFQIEAP